MKLFELNEKYELEFEPAVFTIETFAALKKARKGKVDLLYKELSFIYFFADLKSDFQFQTDPQEREKEIKDQLGLPDSWKPDAKLKACIETYEHLSQTPSSRLLSSIYSAVEKIKTQLENINLNERKTNGDPIWNIKNIVDSVKNIPDLLKAIKEAENEYIKDQQISDMLRKDKVKTVYEDGLVK